jgi:FAD binding domain
VRTEVKSIEDGPAGLRVTLESGGRSENIAAAYDLGAGGAHSVTRHSMQERLEGETYSGRYIVADAKVRLPCPSECGRVIVGPTGFGLFSPLPGDRWLIFVNRDETDTRTERPTADKLGALLNDRVSINLGLHDLRWVSFFKMHKRVAERTSDRRRFLLGDVAHLSRGPHHVCRRMILYDQIKRNLQHIRNFSQSCGRSLSPSAFQVGNVTLSDLSLVRDVELRFTAPLAKHAQRILATSDSVSDFFRNERHATGNLFPRACD